MPVTGDATKVLHCCAAGPEITNLICDAIENNDGSTNTSAKVLDILGALWDTAYEAGKAAGG